MDVYITESRLPSLPKKAVISNRFVVLNRFYKLKYSLLTTDSKICLKKSLVLSFGLLRDFEILKIRASEGQLRDTNTNMRGNT